MSSQTLSRADWTSRRNEDACAVLVADTQTTDRVSRLKAWTILAVAMAIALALRVPGFFVPFKSEIGGWTGAFYSMMARNCLRHGTLIPYLNPLTPLDSGIAYSNHPPTVAWIVAASFSLFGESETAARLPFLLASLASIVLTYRLGCRLGDRSTGLIAAIILAACPPAAVYGHQVEVVGSLLLMAILGTLLAYVDWLEHRTGLKLLRLTLWIGFLLSTDWPAVFFFAVVAFDALIRLRGHRFKVVVATVAGIGFVATIVLLLSVAGSDDGLTHFFKKVYHRSFHFASDEGRSFGVAELLYRYFLVQWTLIGPVLLLPAIAWLVVAIRVRFRQQTIPGLLAAFGLVFLAFGAQGHYQHDFWIHPLSAVYALAVAALFDLLRLRPAQARLILACLIAVVSIHTVFAYHAWAMPRTHYFADTHCTFPTLLDDVVDEGQVIAVADYSGLWPTLPYYADRPVLPVSSPAEVVEAVRQPRKWEDLWFRYLEQYRVLWPVNRTLEDLETKLDHPAMRPSWLLTRNTRSLGDDFEMVAKHRGWFLFLIRQSEANPDSVAASR